VHALIATISAEFGPPLILVNNAGIARDNLLLRMKQEEWDAIINTNLNAIYTVTKECLKGMLKARWGRIISIASVVASTGNAGQTNYSAAKAGLIAFSKSLAQEVATRNITCNIVSPGFIETDMTRDLPEAQQAALLARIPMGRMGQAEEVAHAVAFLASDRASYITGETLHVNGGLYMA
jgi:3-oxoacyl-[acyl-carrier protein] reductase